MHETTVILDRLLVIKFEATIWGGRKKLRKEDLQLADGSVLPPEDLASLGTKKIADPAELAIFSRLKKEAERLCLRVGTRFLGGFAVPEPALAGLSLELDRIVVSFAAERAAFVARYDQAIAAWIDRHPDFAQAIRGAVDPVEVVAAGLHFDYVVFRVSPPTTEADASLPGHERLTEKVGGLGATLLAEIAQDARDWVEQSLLGRASVTRKALRPLRRLRDKLDGLSFLDVRALPLVQSIDQLLGRLPADGALEGPVLHELLAMAMLLSDPDKTQRHGAGLQAEQTRVAILPTPLAPPSLTEPAAETQRLSLATTVGLGRMSSLDRLGLFDGIEDEVLTPFEDEEGPSMPSPAPLDPVEILPSAPLPPKPAPAPASEFWF